MVIFINCVFPLQHEQLAGFDNDNLEAAFQSCKAFLYTEKIYNTTLYMILERLSIQELSDHGKRILRLISRDHMARIINL